MMKQLKITQTVDTVERDYHGVTLKIARANNSAFVQKYRTLIRPVRDEMERGELSVDRDRELLCRALAGTVLVGWSGLESEGVPVDFTEENAASLLFYDVDAREFIAGVAGKVDAFLQEGTETAVKKS